MEKLRIRRYVAGMLLLAAVFAFNISGYPLLDPDEGRNAEVMREMAASNNYAIPTLLGLPYIDKPVLYFSVGAAGMELLGPTVLAARLPSLLFTFGTLVLIGWFARREWGRDAEWIAVLATAATPLTLAFSRIVIPDAALTFWVVLAIVAFYYAIGGSVRSPAAGRAAAWWRHVAWAAIALGVLTKGPIAIGLPLMIAVPYAISQKRSRALVDASTVLLFFVLVLPWVFVMSASVPDYMRYVLITETVGRFTTTELARSGPWWYFLAIVPVAAFPWSAVPDLLFFSRSKPCLPVSDIASGKI